MAVLQTVSITDSARTQSSVLEQAAWISGFAALTAIGAQIEIPHQPIPYTLQTFFVLLSGAFLGARNGFASQLLYLAAGAIGLPVFSGATFGLVRLFGFTGGYLMGFPIAAALIGYLLTLRKGYVWTLFSMFLGLTVIFTLGTVYLNFVSVHDMKLSIVSGFLIFSWWDVLKLSAAAAIYTEISKRFKKLPA